MRSLKTVLVYKMPTLDERVKAVLIDIQETHQKKIDNQISTMVILGFVLGVFFSYTNMLGFCTGFCFGVFTAHKFNTGAYVYKQSIIDMFSNSVTFVKQK